MFVENHIVGNMWSTLDCSGNVNISVEFVSNQSKKMGSGLILYIDTLEYFFSIS